MMEVLPLGSSSLAARTEEGSGSNNILVRILKGRYHFGGSKRRWQYIVTDLLKALSYEARKKPVPR
jgi:hypothetical protein